MLSFYKDYLPLDGTLCCIVLKLFLCLYRQSGKEIIRRRNGSIKPLTLSLTPFLPPAINKAYMNIENTQSQMRKGILEFCILSIIRRGESYPSDIVEEMKGANLNIFEGTILAPRYNILFCIVYSSRDLL